MNKKQSAIAQATKERALEEACERGRSFFKAEPDALLALIHRMASELYADKDQALAFVESYQQARRQHDDYLKEQGR
jgi:hypothetical protein